MLTFGCPEAFANRSLELWVLTAMQTLSYLDLMRAWEWEVRSSSQAGTLEDGTLSIRVGYKNQPSGKER